MCQDQKNAKVVSSPALAGSKGVLRIAVVIIHIRTVHDDGMESRTERVRKNAAINFRSDDVCQFKRWRIESSHPHMQCMMHGQKSMMHGQKSMMLRACPIGGVGGRSRRMVPKCSTICSALWKTRDGAFMETVNARTEDHLSESRRVAPSAVC